MIPIDEIRAHPLTVGEASLLWLLSKAQAEDNTAVGVDLMKAVLLGRLLPKPDPRALDELGMAPFMELVNNVIAVITASTDGLAEPDDAPHTACGPECIGCNQEVVENDEPEEYGPLDTCSLGHPDCDGDEDED